MASAIASASYTQQALESALAFLTDIFGTGTIPASIASVIEKVRVKLSIVFTLTHIQ